MLTFKRLKRITGISLLEVMLSLSIIAVILLMATRYYSVAQNASEIDEARHVIGATVSALQSYKAGTIGALPTAPEPGELVNEGLLPPSGTCTSGGASSASCEYTVANFGDMTITNGADTSACGGGPAPCYIIGIPGLKTASQCSQFASNYSHASCAGTTLSIYVG